MKSTIKIGFLSAAMSILALPVFAQTATPTPAPADRPRSEVGQRMENQQQRIGNGIKDGQLSAGQAAHLERNEQKIHNEVKNDRAANGGKLTPQEKAKVNRQLNRQSNQIYKDKHSGK